MGPFEGIQGFLFFIFIVDVVHLKGGCYEGNVSGMVTSCVRFIFEEYLQDTQIYPLDLLEGKRKKDKNRQGLNVG